MQTQPLHHETLNSESKQDTDMCFPDVYMHHYSMLFCDSSILVVTPPCTISHYFDDALLLIFTYSLQMAAT
jgi:hypothetical protein